MSAPASFRAGDSVLWTESLPAYPASVWTLKFRFLWATGTAVTITATASGDDHAVSLPGSTSQNWPAGPATLVSWVEQGSERVTLAQAAVTILPNLAIAANYDGRSQNAKALDDARAALADYVASGKVHVAEYQVAGRAMKFRSAEEIRDLIGHYEIAVANERALQAMLDGGSPGRVRVRF